MFSPYISTPIPGQVAAILHHRSRFATFQYFYARFIYREGEINIVWNPRIPTEDEFMPFEKLFHADWRAFRQRIEAVTGKPVQVNGYTEWGRP